ncbi:hypothetical protein QFC20_006198 [Naganishia adeliensis]|uniref:Uncharacterized protein n=1 Tax=Naganishia adeliensis TaxID=92952 RepID=A0ACC2VFV7_9TREE|nr:hypothetical protein QFC20_006198 [Naganishia adeliensis]
MASTKDTSLSKAHSLTNQANLLMSNVTGTGNKSDPVILQQALDAFEQGTTLFEQASKDIRDHGAITTVNLLIIQNRKQVKDITRRLNLLKIQERQRQKAQMLSHSPSSNPVAARGTGARESSREVSTKTAGTSEDPGRTGIVKGDAGHHSGSIIDPDMRPRRRRANPGMSMMGSSIFGSSTTGPKEVWQQASSLPGPAPLGSPITSVRKEESMEDKPNTKAVEGTRSLSQSPDDRMRRGMRGGSTATSTSASSMYDGSVYTSGVGYSQGSRSNGSSTFGAFDGEDSFVYFTHPLGSSDPFARFWNVLETAIDQISNPVAFASLPVELPQVPDPIHDAFVKKHRRKHKDKNGKGKHREKEGNKENRDRRNKRKDDAPRKCSIFLSLLTCLKQSSSTLHASAQSNLSAVTVNGKSPEELALENVNLRRSLDALSLRNQVLEQELDTYKQQSDQRQEMMKSVVLGVRREAQKALMQSQMLGSMYLDAGDKEQDRGSVGSSRMGSPLRRTAKPRDKNIPEGRSPDQRMKSLSLGDDEDPFAMDEDDSLETVQEVQALIADALLKRVEWSDGEREVTDLSTLQRRLQEMEAENQILQIENQRSRSHLQKYRDRFERMKISSRAKKEAKMTTGGIQRTSDLPTLGEEGE